MNSGAIIGCIVGLLGGIFGTYAGIKGTGGPRERALMIKMSLVMWIAVSAFLGLLFLLPHPYRWFIFVPYAILLPFGIVFSNENQQRIRQEESQNKALDATSL